ncbi:glycoside hydrolase superfamily [Plectosphaerella plurivora]|uniref:Glycoside hydrolase superfamily n=1 Tax=Plectosphaerella plurivora TaxID=936078 RepID=A0A9P9A637_9PEZI|nr:glycoside hydrolase superfamily [Plectosphaerella plurivora]
MKTFAISMAAIAALGLAMPGMAKPTGPRQPVIEARADNLVTVVDPRVAAPTERYQIVAYVDKDGAPLSKVTQLVHVIPATTAPPTEVLGTPIAPEGKPTPSEVVGTPLAPAGKPAGTATSTTSSDIVGNPIPADHETALPEQANPLGANFTASGDSETSRNLPGIAYAPYTAKGDCKSQPQIEEDFKYFSGKYSLVRIYGTDCDQVAKVVPAAQKFGLRLFLGLFELANIEQQVQHIVDSVKGDWGIVDTVSVGNELKNNGAAQIPALLEALKKTRSLLRASGYGGPVVNVDTFVAVLEHPVLCDESDYCAMNLHPFFDGNVPAPDSGKFVARMVKEVRSKLANKSQRIVVTEIGWPWKGSNNGLCHPGIKEQRQALDSIRGYYSKNPQDVILFSGFNDPWKPSEPATFYAEPYWGIDGRDSKS